MEPYIPIILATFFGFLALAALLLIPVWRFIQRETARGEAWNSHLKAQERARRAQRVNPPPDASREE